MQAPVLLLGLGGACHASSFPVISLAFLPSSRLGHQRSPCPTGPPSPSPGRRVFASPIEIINSTNDTVSDKGYFVRQVSSRARALDVNVFRGIAVPAKQYVAEQKRIGKDISEEEAVDLLMKDYDEDGNYLSNMPQYEPETYFMAVVGPDDDEESLFPRQNNGVVGVVSAQLRRRSPLIAGPSESHDDSSTTSLPSVPIPSPHVYVANMKVDGKMRRRGVGTALLSAVVEYADFWSKQMDERVPLALSVDTSNIGAIRLYERFGFEYLDQNDVFCVMILWP